MVDAGQRAEDRWLISDTISQYAWGYDEGDFALLANSFTEDAVARGNIAGTDSGWGPMTGRSEIVEVLSAIRAGQTDQRRHTITNLLFDALSDATAEVRCYVVLTATEHSKPRLVASGWYRCSMVKESDGKWRMKEQRAQLDSPF